MTIPIGSSIKNLKVGDKLYTTEITNDNGEWDLITKEFELTSIVQNNIEGVDTNGAIMVKMKDTKLDLEVATDISTGYFTSEKESAYALIQRLLEIANIANTLYENKYVKK